MQFDLEPTLEPIGTHLSAPFWNIAIHIVMSWSIMIFQLLYPAQLCIIFSFLSFNQNTALLPGLHLDLH